MQHLDYDIGGGRKYSGADARTAPAPIDAAHSSDTLTVSVQDDGPGLPVSPDQALDPFFTTKSNKKVGLGPSLFRRATESAGGELALGRSETLGGVSVQAWMNLSNVDRSPLGAVTTGFHTMVATCPQPDSMITISHDGNARRSTAASCPGVCPCSSSIRRT